MRRLQGEEPEKVTLVTQPKGATSVQGIFRWPPWPMQEAYETTASQGHKGTLPLTHLLDLHRGTSSLCQHRRSRSRRQRRRRSSHLVVVAIIVVSLVVIAFLVVVAFIIILDRWEPAWALPYR